MKVGDLVRDNFYGHIGIVIARHSNPEWNARWEYTVLWNYPNWNHCKKIWYENELEIINESG